MTLIGNRQKHITMKTTRFFALLALLMVCAVSCNNSKSINGHEYVDLGLPSGTLWATCNIGATMPEEYGDYFAWGETETKDAYNWSSYQYCKDGDSTFTKYCCNSEYGNDGYTDTLTILQDDDDPATAWGVKWHTPSMTQWEELIQYTTNKWTIQNGVKGMLFTANNGKSLFLPAAGVYSNNWFDETDPDGGYWSNSLCTDFPNCARGMHFYSEGYAIHCIFRKSGCSVRPVTSLH